MISFIIISLLAYLFISMSVNSGNVKGFHEELGYTDEEGNEDVSTIIDYCHNTLSTSTLPSELDLNNCDVVMTGLVTLCQDHSAVFSSCLDSRLQDYILTRSLSDKTVDLKELLNLFEEYSISRDIV
jgi:hypothetical protein